MKILVKCLLVLIIGQAVSSAALGGPPITATRNVVLVTADGVRWQEVFRGAEESLLNQKDGGVSDVDALRRDFCATDTSRPPRGAHAIFLERGREARPNLRQSRPGKPGEGRQRHEFLLSRL